MSITEKAFVVENDDEPNGTDTTTGILPSGVQRFQEIDWVYQISPLLLEVIPMLITFQASWLEVMKCWKLIEQIWRQIYCHPEFKGFKKQIRFHIISPLWLKVRLSCCLLLWWLVTRRFFKLADLKYRGSSAYAVFWDFGETTVWAENRVSRGVI